MLVRQVECALMRKLKVILNIKLMRIAPFNEDKRWRVDLPIYV